MRRSLVVANWKMNGSRSTINTLMDGLVADLARGINGVDVVVCPPYPYLQQVAERAQGCELILGAQNAWMAAEGAFTGEVSPAMLADFRVRYVIVGHSERRQLMAETDALVASKFAAIQQAGMVPILCVGETLEQRDAGQAEQVVAGQLQAVLDANGVAAFERAVIAYEPVWAIGTGQSATTAQAQQMHAFIRQWLREHDGLIADSTRLLYGGSVNAGNAHELFGEPDIDGGLVGGASLDPQAFIRICHSVS